MLAVLARAGVNQAIADHAGQTKGIIEFAIGKQTSIGRDPGSVELHLQAAVKNQPQRLVLGFTLRVNHQPCPQIRPTH